MTAGRVGAGRGGGWVKMMDSGIGKYACVSQTQRFSEDDLIQRMTKKVRKMQMEETQNVEAQRRKRFETVRQVFWVQLTSVIPDMVDAASSLQDPTRTPATPMVAW